MSNSFNSHDILHITDGAHTYSLADQTITISDGTTGITSTSAIDAGMWYAPYIPAMWDRWELGTELRNRVYRTMGELASSQQVEAQRMLNDMMGVADRCERALYEIGRGTKTTISYTDGSSQQYTLTDVTTTANATTTVTAATTTASPSRFRRLLSNIGISSS